MELSRNDFSFEYPSELIAQEPADRRDQSRLLVRSPDGYLEEKRFEDIAHVLPENSLIITNNTRVFPSRLFCRTPTGGLVEIFLLALPLPQGDGSRVECLVRPFRKFKVGQVFPLSKGLRATVEEIFNLPSGPAVKMFFNLRPEALLTWCSEEGTMPLPPYIKREKLDDPQQLQDQERYQTVYAKEQGSVAAPTAGLHFTHGVMEDVKARNIVPLEVTLHVGAGTFLPVKSENVSEHFMHSERFLVSSETWKEILSHKEKGSVITAVGTTSFRTLESLAKMAGKDLRDGLQYCDQWQSTDLFIRPRTKEERYIPKIVDSLVTNFHQPESTLFMLICALIGFEEAHRTYRWAIENRFRLFSYGDSSLLRIKS